MDLPSAIADASAPAIALGVLGAGMGMRLAYQAFSSAEEETDFTNLKEENLASNALYEDGDAAEAPVPPPPPAPVATVDPALMRRIEEVVQESANDIIEQTDIEAERLPVLAN